MKQYMPRHLYEEIKEFLGLLDTIGTFYMSAIEIDTNIAPHKDGEDLEKMMRKIMEQMK